MLTKPQRVIDRKYREWIAKQPCFALAWKLTTGEDIGECVGPMDPHHVRKEGHGGIGTKPSDRRCVPACRGHHDLAGSDPGRFRPFFEMLIPGLNSDYDILFPESSQPKQRTLAERVYLTVRNCRLCRQEHKFPTAKLNYWRRGTHVCLKWFCPVAREWVKETS